MVDRDFEFEFFDAVFTYFYGSHNNLTQRAFNEWKLSDKVLKIVGEEGYVKIPLTIVSSGQMQQNENIGIARMHFNMQWEKLSNSLIGYRSQFMIRGVSKDILEDYYEAMRSLEFTYTNKVKISCFTYRGEDVPLLKTTRKTLDTFLYKMELELGTEYNAIFSPVLCEAFNRVVSGIMNSLTELEQAASTQIADLEGDLVISALPSDLLTISENDWNWGSCTSWDSEYKYTPFAHVRGESTLVAYFTQGSRERMERLGFSLPNKRWRMLIYLGDNGSVALSRQYPSSYPFLVETVLNFLKEKIGGEVIGLLHPYIHFPAVYVDRLEQVIVPHGKSCFSLNVELVCLEGGGELNRSDCGLVKSDEVCCEECGDLIYVEDAFYGECGEALCCYCHDALYEDDNEEV